MDTSLNRIGWRIQIRGVHDDGRNTFVKDYEFSPHIVNNMAEAIHEAWQSTSNSLIDWKKLRENEREKYKKVARWLLNRYVDLDGYSEDGE